MFKRWVVQAVLMFVVRQISKYGRNLRWELVKSDVAERVARLVPGTVLDSACVDLSLEVVEAAEKVLTAKPNELKEIATLVFDGQIEEAAMRLWNLMASDGEMNASLVAAMAA